MHRLNFCTISDEFISWSVLHLVWHNIHLHAQSVYLVDTSVRSYIVWGLCLQRSLSTQLHQISDLDSNGLRFTNNDLHILLGRLCSHWNLSLESWGLSSRSPHYRYGSYGLEILYHDHRSMPLPAFPFVSNVNESIKLLLHGQRSEFIIHFDTVCRRPWPLLLNQLHVLDDIGLPSRSLLNLC